MKMTIFTIFMGILVLLAFVLVVVNRNSEKIVSAAVPLAFAAFAALALVFAFAREEPITRVFPVNFCYQVQDKLPIVITGRPFPHILHLVDQVRQQDPKALDEPMDIHPGGLVYHELLQKGFIEWIAMRHFANWRMELLRFESGVAQEFFQPFAEAAQESSKILSSQELQRRFGGNRFARVHTGMGTLALPPGTNLTIHTPKTPDGHGEIHLKNCFCEIKIRTSPGLSMSGIYAYSWLMGIEPPERGYYTGQYIVRITATFSPVLVGHPRMALLKRWATGILDGLQHDFDEQVVWRRTVENQMILRHVTGPIQVSGERTPFAAVRFTAPQNPASPGNSTNREKAR